MHIMHINNIEIFKFNDDLPNFSLKSTGTPFSFAFTSNDIALIKRLW